MPPRPAPRVKPLPKNPNGPAPAMSTHCTGCGAPLDRRDHRCAWCLTTNPNWQWRSDDAIEVTTLQDTQRVFVSAHPVDERALDDLRRQWFEQHSRPAAIVPPPGHIEAPPADWLIPAVVFLAGALAGLFIFVL